LRDPPNHPRRGRPVTAEELARLDAAMAYIRENFAKAPRLPEIARRAGMSPFHFHRRFHLAFGRTPKSVVTELQIAEAKRLLRAGVRPRDVAERLGFTHQSHFAARFRVAVGATPTRWLRVQAP
jgi:AraC-like DNA-binding protein